MIIAPWITELRNKCKTLNNVLWKVIQVIHIFFNSILFYFFKFSSIYFVSTNLYLIGVKKKKNHPFFSWTSPSTFLPKLILPLQFSLSLYLSTTLTFHRVGKLVFPFLSQQLLHFLLATIDFAKLCHWPKQFQRIKVHCLKKVGRLLE